MPRAFTPDEQATIRQRLRAAAVNALEGIGLRRTPVSDLVRTAGISKGAFYRFYESKEALAVDVMQQGEDELRAAVLSALDGPDPLRGVLRTVFEAPRHPLLRLLGDPEEFAWLTRGLPEATLQEARRDDERFFTEVHAQLVAGGHLGPDSLPVFLGLPGAALALAQGRAWMAPHDSAVTDALIEGLVCRAGQEGDRQPP